MHKDKEDFEFYDEWEARDEELENISLEDFNEECVIEEYGITDEELNSENLDD